MVKQKFPIKTSVFLLVSLFVLSLTKDIPETNAFLKDTDTKQALTSAGDLNVAIKDDTAIGTLAVNTTYSRDLFVKNDGDTDMFIRALVHPTLEDSKGYQLVLNKKSLIPTLSPDWMDGKDGYYYYKKNLISKTTTLSPIFKSFDTTQLKEADTLTLHIKVEAITSKGTTYRKAWWNGVEPSSTELSSLVDLDAILLAEST